MRNSGIFSFKIKLRVVLNSDGLQKSGQNAPERGRFRGHACACILPTLLSLAKTRENQQFLLQLTPSLY